MKLNDKYYVIEKMVQLIDREKTGNSIEFSNKLGISRSQLFVDFDEFKSLGVEVCYDRSNRSFFFSGNKKLIVRKPILVVNNDELSLINGGFFNKKSSVLFFGRYSFNLAIENFH